MTFSYSYPPEYAYPSRPPLYRPFPAPPRLHWAWVLVLSVVTFGIFWVVWMVVQARWVKKATGNPRAFAWSLANLLFIPLIFVLAIAGNIVFYMTTRADFIGNFMTELADFSRIVGFLLYIASVYLIKSALESSPIKLRLHGLATFFFGPIYFQYYLRDYSVEGKVGEQLSGFGEDAVAPVAELPPQA